MSATSFCAIGASAPNGRACFPCSQLGDLASGTAGTLVYGVISVSAGQESLWSDPDLAEAALPGVLGSGATLERYLLIWTV